MVLDTMEMLEMVLDEQAGDAQGWWHTGNMEIPRTGASWAGWRSAGRCQADGPPCPREEGPGPARRAAGGVWAASGGGRRSPGGSH